MKKLEKYTGEKVYMFPNGFLATREAVLNQFPAAEQFTFVVTTDERGEVMMGMDNLSILRGVYNIDNTLSEDEAITAIEEIINKPVEATEEVSDQTRIADALEDMVVLQELNALEA